MEHVYFIWLNILDIEEIFQLIKTTTKTRCKVFESDASFTIDSVTFLQMCLFIALEVVANMNVFLRC